MLRRMIFAGLGILALAACTPQTPTQTAAPDGAATSAPIGAPTLVMVTREAVTLQPGELSIPLPGTLIASETEDPNADVPFTRIQLARLRGGVLDELVIEGGGTFTYNGASGVLSPQQIFNLNEEIRKINFFGLQGLMMSQAPQPDSYEYGLTIYRGEQSATIVSQDKFMPATYKAFVAAIWSTRDLLIAPPTAAPVEAATSTPQ